VPRWSTRATSWLTARPFLLFASLYAAIALLAALASLVVPAPIRAAVDSLTGGHGLGVADPGFLTRGPGRIVLPEAPLWAIAGVAMVSAGALALPVTWLYTITRAKRGYSQSVVHSLVLLPVIVAGVVVLVKFSLALAFSLAGIVAAVRFRNTLEDSKDAVYIFVATGIGLASGVELTVALSISFVFNLVAVLLFRSDFGRTPARLEGELAQARLQEALDVANRTSEFVARLDREILEQMAPQQLEALADRAWQRRRDAAVTTGGTQPARLDTLLRVTTDGGHKARERVESLLRQLAKEWRFQSASDSPSGHVVEYALRLRKSVQPTLLLETVRRESGSGIRDAELK
jgi:hypothetical protein